MPIRLHGFALAISVAASLCVVPIASAADLPGRFPARAPAYKAYTMEPAYNWTGWYIGAQLGGSRGEANHSIVTDAFGFLNAPFGPTKIDGFNYGGLFGYDYQLSSMWVVGVNTEFNGGKLKGLFDNAPVGDDDIYQSEVRWFGSTRAKLGFIIPIMPQVMLYGTGGVAYAKITAANGDGLGGFPVLDDRQATGSKTKIGYTAGGGASWMIPGSRFVLSAEGAYYDFGTARINTVRETGATHIFDVQTSFISGRAILSYRF